MSAYPNCALRSANNFSDFRVRSLLKPMELDHFSLTYRELFERTVEEGGTLPQLDRHEVGLGRGLGVDLEVGLFAALRAPPMFAYEVHGDGHDPGSQLRALAEVVACAVEPKERLLDDFLGELVVAEVASRQSKEDGRIALEEVSKRSLVS